MKSRAQESTNTIGRVYVIMRHLFTRGFYKPMNVSGEALHESLLVLCPEIHGSVVESRTEPNGLICVFDRLPEGIEQCLYTNLIADEGYRKSHFKPIIPPKRRRNCYRIDDQQMNIEITCGCSDIYDVLTHLTLLFIESHKITDRISLDDNKVSHDWEKVIAAVSKPEPTLAEREACFIHIGNLLGCTFEEVLEAHNALSTVAQPNRLIHIIYWLGKIVVNERFNDERHIVTFSTVLRERIGYHLHGEIWAEHLKHLLLKCGLLHRPIHIISANMHSVMNSLFAQKAIGTKTQADSQMALFKSLSKYENEEPKQKVKNYARSYGMISVDDASGTNIDVQLFDTARIDFTGTPYDLSHLKEEEKPVLLVMDYAFGEQAYETIGELLKPYHKGGDTHFLDVVSVPIMDKASILKGNKGDVMIPTLRIFEGATDDYSFNNGLSKADFEGHRLKVFEGSVITVLGTSLQNKDILKFFLHSMRKAVGLEMEGVHYQKAIQSASKICKSIREDVKVRYAYYASDNPLETGSTLASGGLGIIGVKPTYLIALKILEQIFSKS